MPVAAPAPNLAVNVGAESRVLDPVDGVVVLGRDPQADIRVNDDRISRSHLRLEPHENGWQAVDTSSNGTFVDGVRRGSVVITGPTTIHLGDADGIPVVVSPRDPLESTQPLTDADLRDVEDWTTADQTDPDVARAGRAVAARRRELDITQRSLARDKIINAGALIAFEKGRSWPRRGTLAKLEEILHWPPGTIARIRHGSAGPDDGEVTEVITNTVQAPLMAQAVELAMHTISTAIAGLPQPSEPGFAPQVNAILDDLRKLESVAANAARSAKGTPTVVLALSAVRRSYHELMQRAARSPAPTLGQRLYAARHRAGLTVEETANAAGLAVAVIAAAEAEHSIPPDAAAAVETLIAHLGAS
jgi:transcriptional regulator with XRE-family HTH domain